MTTTIELVLFNLKPSVREVEFLSALAASTDWLARQPGFILRRHGVREGGEHVDCLEWASLAHAKAAAVNFVAAGETRAFNDAISPGSAAVRHFEMLAGA